MACPLEAGRRSRPEVGRRDWKGPPIDKASYGTHLGLVKTIKISEAKRNFSKVFARAKRGETIILQNGDDYVQLVPCVMFEPTPLRPAGFFVADDDTIRIRNGLGEESAPGK